MSGVEGSRNERVGPRRGKQKVDVVPLPLFLLPGASDRSPQSRSQAIEELGSQNFRVVVRRMPAGRGERRRGGSGDGDAESEGEEN